MGPSIADLQRLGGGFALSFALQELTFRNAPYAEFATLIRRAISHSISLLIEQKNVLKKLSEDQITVYLIAPLRTMMFDVAHDRNVGGRADISIIGYSDYLWLAEAKIFTSYSKLLGGYQQLVHRYATGYPNQDQGSMLIYMRTSGAAKGKMEKWRDFLLDNEDGVTITGWQTPLTFQSEQDHPGTGLPFKVDHVPIVLFHSPKDAK